MDQSAYPLEFLYDGQCPICLFDVARLQRRDGQHRLLFVDISAPDFQPARYGRTREDLLARIHGRRADGVMVDGPEVFRLALAAVGWRRLVALSRWPVLHGLTEMGYRVFARHRVLLSRHVGGVFARLTPACDTGCCRRD